MTDDDIPVPVWVETHQHPNDKVTVVERWIPAAPGEYAPLLFGPWGKKIPMKLESRHVVPTPASRP
jgi:hypothetical protein